MKLPLKITFTIASLAFSTSTQAQNLNSAYFLDGYVVGHELNPAKDYERQSYFSMPLLGNVNMGLKGNLSLTDVIKTWNGVTTTYLNPHIPVQEALSGFDDNNQDRFDMRLDIISFGFHKWNGYNTFNLSLRSNLGVNAPYELFEVTKNLTNKSYDISNMRASTTTWAEAAFGHSHQVTYAVHVGGKFKFLLAGARSNVELHNARLDLTAPDQWVLTADAQAQVSVKGFDWGEKDIKEYKTGGTYEQINFNNINVNGAGINGWGLGFDLGAEWDLGKQDWVKGLKLSLAVLDLGFLKWNETHTAYNLGKEVIFKGFNNVKIKDGTGVTLKDQANEYADRFSDLMAMQEGDVISSTSALGATINLGVEYALPCYDKLSFGLLSTTRIQSGYTWNEERFSVTISPLKWLEGSVNLAYGSFGPCFGWVANIHTKGFSLFMGMDHLMGKLTKQGIPFNGNSNFSVGINFPLGKLQ